MKKMKKTLASLIISGILLTMVSSNAFATDTIRPNRLAGANAEQTAVAIADQTGWTGTAILASSTPYGMVDALTAGPLATFLKAPILLQDNESILNTDTKAELIKLKVTKVYVTSGKAVISQTVLDQLKGMGVSIESLGGTDRFETSVNIAKKLISIGTPVNTVAIANGRENQDALSIAPIASANNMPILLTEKDYIPACVKDFLDENTSIISSDIIGGTGVVSNQVSTQLPSPVRIAGTAASDTNIQVLQYFASSLDFNNIYVANGVTCVDVLAGAPLAAQTKSPIILWDGTFNESMVNLVGDKFLRTSFVMAIGGEVVVPENVRVLFCMA